MSKIETNFFKLIELEIILLIAQKLINEIYTKVKIKIIKCDD
jgi:hypothetical protein